MAHQKRFHWRFSSFSDSKRFYCWPFWGVYASMIGKTILFSWGWSGFCGFGGSLGFFEFLGLSGSWFFSVPALMLPSVADLGSAMDGVAFQPHLAFPFCPHSQSTFPLVFMDFSVFGCVMHPENDSFVACRTGQYAVFPLFRQILTAREFVSCSCGRFGGSKTILSGSAGLKRFLVLMVLKGFVVFGFFWISGMGRGACSPICLIRSGCGAVDLGLTGPSGRSAPMVSQDNMPCFAGNFQVLARKMILFLPVEWVKMREFPHFDRFSRKTGVSVAKLHHPQKKDASGFPEAHL